MIKLSFKGDIDGLINGITEISGEKRFVIAEDGYPVTAKKGDGLYVSLKREGAEIIYPFKAAFFRGLSLIIQHFGEEYSTRETPCFDKNGIMLDSSRNAVLRPETVKYILRKTALMGLNTAMLYTEDTYEIPDEPYFGYLRGRYTYNELKELDDYAYSFGIELIPCIQTLSHLEAIFKWSEYKGIANSPRTLLAGEEKTYELIEKMVVAASAPFRSDRIHIGMDEARDINDGVYRARHGDCARKEVLKAHFDRVYEILKKHGLKGMMWGDMFIEAERRYVPQDIELVNWNYYAEREIDYQYGFNAYSRVTDRIIFAGGIWTWLGMGVDYTKTVITTQCALKKCLERGCREVFVTAWGDDGGETPLLSALYGMQMYAEFQYTQDFDTAKLSERFAACTGQSAADFLKLTEFLRATGDNITNSSSAWSKDLLYEDPLIPIFEKDRAPIKLTEHYRQLSDYYASVSTDDRFFSAVWKFYLALAKVLHNKGLWYEAAAAACKNGGSVALNAAGQAKKVIGLFEELKAAWYDMWYLCNKPQGFEIIDIRLGAQISRFKTAVLRMTDLAENKITEIEELTEPKLLYMRSQDGVMKAQSRWDEIVSAGHMHHY